MSTNFISEKIEPLEASFDTARMSTGAPGVPARFRWRQQEYVVTEVLEEWKEHGDCAHGSGERYVRRHVFRVRVADGAILRIYFQRSFGRARFDAKGRWWLLSVE